MSGTEDPLPASAAPGPLGSGEPDGHRNNIPGAAPSSTANVPGGHPTGPNVRVTATFRAAQNINPTNNNNGEIPPQQTQNLFHMRDRLFLALFFRVTLIYARACPKTLRRILEFCLLIQSISLLFILAYIHVVYTRTPITCLAEHKNSWPRDGILRVEITNEEEYDIAKSYEKEERIKQRAASSQIGHYSDDFLTMMFDQFDSRLLIDRFVTTAGEYFKSFTSSDSKSAADKNVATQGATGDDPSQNSPQSTLMEGSTSVDVESSATSTVSDGGGGQESSVNMDKNEDNEVDSSLASTQGNNNSDGPKQDVSEDELGISLATAGAGGGENIEISTDDPTNIAPSFLHTASGSGSAGASGLVMDDTSGSVDPESLYFNKTLEEIEIMKMQKKQMEEEAMLKSSVSDFEMFSNSVWLHDHQPYIVEYSLEYGFLRISPETRSKLNIPVKIVTLDPTKDSCFGDAFSRFLLDNFLGYDDILMASIKNLAEYEDNRGYLRNVVTGEQFRFVQMWMARTSYIPAFLIMTVFTVSISMLLRYSHHQIFVFIVDLLNNIEGAGSIHIPTAPLFTVILALVGMEAIMSEFFNNDTSTAFYVILIVWIADQYDSVCSHTTITKTYWVRFFYLYHFAFYAYHYRFNGQYGGLALLVSWSFIQHSMVYFFHHYELPAILRQAAHQNVQNNPGPEDVGSSGPTQNQGGSTQTGAPAGTGNTGGGNGSTGGSTGTTTENESGLLHPVPVTTSRRETSSSLEGQNQPSVSTTSPLPSSSVTNSSSLSDSGGVPTTLDNVSSSVSAINEGIVPSSSSMSSEAGDKVNNKTINKVSRAPGPVVTTTSEAQESEIEAEGRRRTSETIGQSEDTFPTISSSSLSSTPRVVTPQGDPSSSNSSSTSGGLSGPGLLPGSLSSLAASAAQATPSRGTNLVDNLVNSLSHSFSLPHPPSDPATLPRLSFGRVEFRRLDHLVDDEGLGTLNDDAGLD